ncbi:MAG: DNA-binding protein [Cytophagaceae bacterium SCN 52-12]|nr:MAG: DNA-binding protein [Cytophagaceae bacterium SCN 52-12]
MPADESIKRFERIVAILIQLQSKRVVRAQELAERFDVSLRTVYRDIRSLESAGVPIAGEAGVGYSLVEGYRLPPVVFTREEAFTFVAAEKLMQKFVDESLGRHFQSAMFKIKSVLKDEQKDRVETVRASVRVTRSEKLFNKDVPDVLGVLFEAIAEKKQVVLLYQSVEAEAPNERSIEPVGIFHQNNNWYLLAYCHLRKDYRQFRADRIYGIRLTEDPFALQHESLDYFLSRDYPISKKRVRLLAGKNAARFLKWDRKHFGFVSEKEAGDKVEMLFESDYTINGFARWYLMFADQVDILEPEELKDEVNELVTRISERIGKG